MITIVEGVLGGGKTVYAVRETLSRLARGGHVFTNIDMVRENVHAYLLARHGVYLRSSQLQRLPEGDEVVSWLDSIQFGTLENPILVVLDEAHMWYNARDWKATHETSGDVLSFLTQSRKVGVDLLFISQDAKNVESQFRRMAQVLVRSRNLGMIKDPIFGLKLSGFFHYELVEMQHQNTFERKWWRADSSVFRCYRTEALLDDLMNEIAKGKLRLENFSLREASTIRKLASSFADGDPIERACVPFLRRWAAAQIHKQRHARFAALPTAGALHRSGSFCL